MYYIRCNITILKKQTQCAFFHINFFIIHKCSILGRSFRHRHCHCNNARQTLKYTKRILRKCTFPVSLYCDKNWREKMLVLEHTFLVYKILEGYCHSLCYCSGSHELFLRKAARTRQAEYGGPA